MNDLWDDVQYIGSAFNFFTPGFAFFQDLFNGPVAHFGVTTPSGWRKRDVKRLLMRHRIESWGYVYLLDFLTLSFSVRKADARRAYEVLEEAGVPLDSVPEAARETRRKGWFE